MATRSSKKKKNSSKLIILLVEVVIILVLLVGLLIWLKLGRANWDETVDQEEIVETVVEEQQLDEETIELLNNYTTIAFFGVDNRSNGSYDTGNSDSVMVVSINNNTKEVRVVSVYRDTYLEVSKNSYRKCNYAYNHGGPKQAIEMLDRCMDLDITDYVAVDFYALAEVVDAMGGLEIDVSKEEAAEMNGGEYYASGGTYGYIQQVSEITGIKSTWPIKGGVQVLDGCQTVAYCRIRHCGGDDFARTERQREVVSLLVKKIMSADVGTLNKIVDKVLPKVSTSFSASQVLELAASAKDYSIGQTSGFPFELTTGTFGSKGSLVVPCSLESNVTALHRFLFDADDYEPTETVKSISSKISSDTSTSTSSATKSIGIDDYAND